MLLDLPEMKKIEWLFNKIYNGYSILSIELFKVTEDNSTVILKEVKFENEFEKEKVEKSNYQMIWSHHLNILIQIDIHI